MKRWRDPEKEYGKGQRCSAGISGNPQICNRTKWGGWSETLQIRSFSWAALVRYCWFPNVSNDLEEGGGIAKRNVGRSWTKKVFFLNLWLFHHIVDVWVWTHESQHHLCSEVILFYVRKNNAVMGLFRFFIDVGTRRKPVPGMPRSRKVFLTGHKPKPCVISQSTQNIPAVNQTSDTPTSPTGKCWKRFEGVSSSLFGKNRIERTSDRQQMTIIRSAFSWTWEWTWGEKPLEYHAIKVWMRGWKERRRWGKKHSVPLAGWNQALLFKGSLRFRSQYDTRYKERFCQ